MSIRIAEMVALGLALTAYGCNPRGGDQGGGTAIPNGDTLPVEQSSSAGLTILFPREGEKLVKGGTYTLKWDGGEKEVSVFLVDSALESAGASVSISDRVYGVENKGSYRYKVPERLEEGTYKFTIGAASSPYFKVVSADTTGTGK